MTETSGVYRLSALWQAQVKRRPGRAMFGLFLLAVVLAAQLGRIGTGPARVGAALLIALALLLAVARRVRERRRFASAEGIIRTVLAPTDPDAAARALRAQALLGTTASDAGAGSHELAALHFRRVLERVPAAAVERVARRRASRLAWAAVLLIGVSGAVLFAEPMRVAEGLDVLVARRGVAPVPFVWLSMVRVSVQPPAYLRSGEQIILPALENELPEGSAITVRGVPEHAGRRLVLSDGQREVAFVDDGAGNVVARWELTKKARLFIAARFAEVLIPEPEALEFSPIADEAPRVVLEDAPRELALRDLERLEFRYEASDDHGLKQIELVLRSGGREDRRPLARLDGQTKTERGAHALSVRDPFLRRMFLPVVATIEARDNDARHPSKWGHSAAVTIVPPAVGEPQALRYQALIQARDGLIDLVAYDLETERLKREGGASPAERASARSTLKKAALSALSGAATGVYAGARVPTGLASFVQGQTRALEKPTGDARKRTEDVLLALDAGIRALGNRDAAEVSRKLGDVAEEAAEGAKLAFNSEKRAQGQARLATALTALDAGAKNLVTLATLGADLGSVASGETRRIRRGQAAGSYADAELAARHLAARLRRPSPSFSSAGGGGVESGRGAQGPGEASDADRQFDQLMQELAQLASEHAEQVRSIEDVLKDSEQGADSNLSREANERAARLREAIRNLPDPGAQPGSARAAGALAREHMNAMAQNLERLALKDVIDGGRRAESQLSEAKRLAREPRGPSDWLDEAPLAAAEKELADQLEWAEGALSRQRERAAARAAADLNELARREEAFSRRAANLAGRGENSEAKLADEEKAALEDAENAMQNAARELAAGRGEQGLELSREAQRLLERSNPGKTTDPDEDRRQQPSEGKDGDSGKEFNNRGHVPGADKARGAEDFRKRVLDGLSKERRGRLGPAVERYAEGLLE